jgi:preprotein translocase subunit Sec63
MSNLESIIDALNTLNLSSVFSINDINNHYKELLFKWHPDHCVKNPEECKEMTRKIIEAYNIIMTFCYNYKFSLGKEDVEKMTIDDPEGFWNNKFGHDPLWGFPDKK